mmetsp:Transcript_8358/g.10571  ORF Transcript_8358/g.10571 Transcript_8358/m.10571 type:complete len:103 (-) Transcript_8358:375-683(-)
MESIGLLEEKNQDKHNEKDTKSAESSQTPFASKKRNWTVALLLTMSCKQKDFSARTIGLPCSKAMQCAINYELWSLVIKCRHFFSSVLQGFLLGLLFVQFYQ